MHYDRKHSGNLQKRSFAPVKKPLDLPEDKIVEIEVRDVSESEDKEKWLKDFDEWMNSLDPNTPNLTDEQISRESIYEEQLNRQR